MERKREIFFNLFVMGLSVAIFIGSFYVSGLSGSAIGPGFFPRIVAVCMFITSSILFVKGMKIKVIESKNEIDIKNVLITILILIAYVLMFEPLGFTIATMVFLFALMTHFREKALRNYAINGIIAIVVSLGIYKFFVGVLNLMLPSGVL